MHYNRTLLPYTYDCITISQFIWLVKGKCDIIIAMQININDYFDIDKIIESGQTFRARKIDDNLYRFISLDKVLYISKVSAATYEVSCTEDEWDNFWYDYFDLGRSYKDIVINDDYAMKCFETSKGIRILSQEPFEMLISFTISQRKSIPAIRTSIELICDKFGTAVKTEYDDELHLFPTVEQLASDMDTLSECKLGYRLPYIIDAVNTVYNDPDFLNDGYNMGDEELLNHLITIKGVGEKVANCVALFSYNRLGLAPIDTWISKIIDTYYNGTSPFDNYGDNAGIIQQYMFYYAITHKNEL